MKRLFVYLGKCVTGVLTVLLLAQFFNYEDYVWALISVILVISPDGTDALILSINRIKANLVGAGAGLLMLLLHPPAIILVTGGVAITVVVCYFMKLENPTRSALAASIIVTLHQSGKHIWDTALERIIAVLLGCLLGLIITFIFHSKLTKRRAEAPTGNEEA